MNGYSKGSNHPWGCEKNEKFNKASDIRREAKILGRQSLFSTLSNVKIIAMSINSNSIFFRQLSKNTYFNSLCYRREID